MYCVQGFEKDANGCDTCVCPDPCRNCTENQTCFRMTLDCPGNDPRCANSYIGHCVDKVATTSSTTTTPTTTTPTTTTPTTTTSAATTPSTLTSQSTPRPCLMCMMRCPYLMLKKSDGCPVCRCYEPCQSVNCRENTTCQVFENDCASDPDCPPNIRFRGQCVETTAAVSTTTTTVSTTTATPTSTGHLCPIPLCVNNCPYGNAKDSNGCRTCDCHDPCERVTCNATEICVRVSSQECVEDMCRPAYKAVCERNCTRPTNCHALNCTYGFAKGADGCEICQCFDPCLDVACPANEHCAVRSDYKCTGMQCGFQPTGYCTVLCPSVADCNISCEFGFAKDASDCKMCQCHDPCMGYSCEDGQTCVPSNFPIYSGQPIQLMHLGQCRECKETMTCRMACPYGLAKNKTTECDMCRCYEPCQNVTCPSGKVCRAKEQFNGRYRFVAECAEPCGPNCDMACQYGMVRDASGCETCKCIYPCENVTCPSGQQCIPKKRFNSENQFVAQCEETSATVSANPTTRNRPEIDCPMPLCYNPCFYGTMIDHRGCQTCTCRSDPCSGHLCTDSDKICGRISFCPDNFCTPSPVCVDRPRPCNGLQREYQKSFGNSVDKAPQLNCNSRGRFQPIQCSQYECWCVDENGTPTTNRSAMDLNCYSGKVTKEVLRIKADFNVIEPGEGWRFKQQVSQQMADRLGIDESFVTIRKYKTGSIIADVMIGSDASTDMSAVQDKLEMAKLMPFNITYDNGTYEAILLGGPQPPTTPPTTAGPNIIPAAPAAGEGHLLMIILICVFVPIAIVAIAGTIWIACKIILDKRANPARRLSEKSGFSTEVNSLESGSDKGYVDEKFSSITKDPKIAKVIDTTEA